MSMRPRRELKDKTAMGKRNQKTGSLRESRRSGCYRRIVKFHCLKDHSPFVTIGRFIEIPMQMLYYFYLWEHCSTHSHDESFGHYNPLVLDQSMGCLNRKWENGRLKMDSFSSSSSSSSLFASSSNSSSDRNSSSGSGNWTDPRGQPQPILLMDAVPLGNLMQVFLLMRLTASCFVGYWEMGTEIRSQTKVLRHACRRMWSTLILAFPYQIIEPATYCNLPMIVILFQFNYIFAFRWNRIMDDFLFLEKYLGPLYKLICFFLYAFCLDSFFSFIWVVIPFWSCYEKDELTDNHIEFNTCVDDECTLRTFDYPACMNETWITAVHKTLPPVPVWRNGTMEMGYFSPKKHNVPLLLADLHVFTSFRTVGIGITTADCYSEFGLSVFMIFLGYYLYCWHLSGLMQMFYLEKELQKTEFRVQLSIIETYCDFHGVCARSRLRMRQFLDLKFLWDRDLFNDIAFRHIPDDYRNGIMAVTLLSALDKVRIFRGIPADNMIALCDQFRTMLFIRGQTIKRPYQTAPGLMLLRRGVIVVISLEEEGSGSIIKLERGDYFGEINLLFPYGTPLLILAATDCEVWSLPSSTYSRLAGFFTGAVKTKLLFNLKAIMDATVCVFHEEYDIFSPRNLRNHVQKFINGEVEVFPMHLFEDDRSRHLPSGSSSSKARMHDQSRSYRIWSIVVATAGLLTVPICGSNPFPWDFLDVLWPGNPYSVYVHCKEGSCSYWEWTYSLLLWVISFFCIADCAIWFYIGIVSPYGIISGKKAAKEKFMFAHLGAVTIAKIVSTFYVGFKFLRIRDVAKMIIPFSFNVHIFTISLALVVVCLCYYFCRIFLVLSVAEWEELQFCKAFESVWGKDASQVKATLDGYCRESFGREDCREDVRLLEDPRFRDESFMEKHQNIPYYAALVLSLRHLCDRNITITPSMSRFYNTLYIFYDFATTQGSGSIITFWGVNRLLPNLLRWITDIALLISAAMTAKLTARNLGMHLCHINFKTQQKSLKETLNVRNVPAQVQVQLLHYMENAYNTYNRIAMPAEAIIIEDMPTTLKLTKHQYDCFVAATNYFIRDPDCLSAVFRRCKHYAYPPGCILTSNGSGAVFQLILVQGYVAVIDCFGCKKVRGPGQVISMVSLWVNENFSTAVSMTHVKGIVLDEHGFEGCLDFPQLKRCWTSVHTCLVPVLQHSIDDFTRRGLIQDSKDHMKSVNALILKAKRQDYHKTYKANRRASWHKFIFLHRTFFLSRMQQYILIDTIGNSAHAISAFLATLQAGFRSSTDGMNYSVALLDALILLELYFRIHVVWIKNARFITTPDKIARELFLHDWALIIFKFPLEYFIIPFHSLFEKREDFHTAYLILRGFRGFRFIESFRRLTALTYSVNVNLQLSTWISCIFHFLVHIHIMGILWFYTNCDPTYRTEGDHRFANCRKASWQLRSFDQRTNFYNASSPGVFDSQLHESTDFGSFFTKKFDPTCILGKTCAPSIREKFDMYLTSGNANRKLGERKDEFALRYDVIDVNQCYSLCLYWAAQTLTQTGFGDVNIASREELLIFFFFFLASIIHATYITAKIVGVYISHDPDENEAFAEKSETHSYLVSKSVSPTLIKKVTRAKEMHQAYRTYVIPRSRENLPKIIYNHAKYHLSEPVFHLMYMTGRCTRSQLGLLSELFTEVLVPQGDYIIRKGEVVDGIFVLADGTGQYFEADDSVSSDDEGTLIDEEEAKRDSKRHAATSWTSQTDPMTASSKEKSKDQRMMDEGMFQPGTCFGIDNGLFTDSPPLAFWHYDVVARHNCRLLYLSGEAVQEHRERLERALSIMTRQVLNTKDEIKSYRQQSEKRTARSLRNFGKNKSKAMPVFHPTDSVLNVILISCHSIKLMAIQWSVLLAMYIGKEGPYPKSGCPEKDLPYTYKKPDHFDMIYALVVTISYSCVVLEIVMQNFTGYMEEGRTIMDSKMIRTNYLRKKSLFLVDALSLLPIPYLYLVEGVSDYFDRNGTAAILLFLPQMLQIYRTAGYFTQPRQMEPFSGVILTAKTIMRIILLICSYVMVVSLVLIITSCSELQPVCRFTWIEFAHKSYTIDNNLSIILLSIYFTITMLVATGYGDLTAHVVLERYTLTLIMCLCMMNVAICQARITTNIFKVAARSKLYTQRIEKLRMALEANEVKPSIIAQATGYLRVAYGHHGGKQLQTLLKDLHPSLRKQVHYEICKEFMRQLPYFHDLPLGIHQYISLFVDAACYLPGDVIVGRGDIVSTAYFLSEGQAVLKWASGAATKMKTGSIIFRDRLVKPRPTKNTLVAETLAIVFFLEYADFSRIIHSLSSLKEEQCMSKVWSDYHREMKVRYGDHKVYKGLAMDRTVFRLSDTYALLQNDVKCREKLKIDRTNSEHAGYRLTFLPQSRASLNRDEYA